jgi:hypothetical protein
MTSSDTLRRHIDRGETADKIPFPDPAAAPLGTDDEAAGRPPEAARVAMARSEETKPAALGGIGPGATDERARPLTGEPSRGMRRLVAVMLAVLVIAAVAVVVFGTVDFVHSATMEAGS